MGRRKDSPAKQAAKGNPGKRMSRAERAAVAIMARAEEIARQALASDDPFEPPPLLTDNPIYFADGILAWRDIVDSLRAKGRLDASYVQMMAIWAVNVNRWARALRSLIADGDYQRIKNVSGTFRRVHNPARDDADAAEKTLNDLARAFGLAPLYDHDLLKVQSFNRSQGDLFPGSRTPATRDEAPPAPEPVAADPFGAMQRAASPAPGKMN